MNTILALRTYVYDICSKLHGCINFVFISFVLYVGVCCNHIKKKQFAGIRNKNTRKKKEKKNGEQKLGEMVVEVVGGEVPQIFS